METQQFDAEFIWFTGKFNSLYCFTQIVSVIDYVAVQFEGEEISLKVIKANRISDQLLDRVWQIYMIS